MDAKDIVKAIRAKHRGEIVLTELRGGSGYSNGVERYIDVWVMHEAPSKGNRRRAYEVKVSRSDFLRDIKQPQKHRPARLYSNEFYFVCQADLLKPEDIPDWAGLLYVRETHDGGHYVSPSAAVPAPWFDTEPPPWRFVVSLMRAAAKQGVEDMFLGKAGR